MELRIPSWENTRTVEFEPERVLLQVDLRECPRCHPCAARVGIMKRWISKTDVQVDWFVRDGEQWISVPLRDGDQPLAAIQRILPLTAEIVITPADKMVEHIATLTNIDQIETLKSYLTSLSLNFNDNGVRMIMRALNLAKEKL